MLESGYIQLYRSMLAWEWYQDQNTKDLFIHLLLTANYYDKKWRGIVVKRGQRVCSYVELSRELNISVQSIRTAVKHLKSTGELTHLKTPEYSLLTVNNYDKYQEPTQVSTDEQQTVNTPPTDDQQAANKPPTSHQQLSKKANKANKAKKEINTGDTRAPARKPFGEFQKVLLTDEQYERLLQRLGKDEASKYICKLDGYIASKGARYKDHCATILTWWWNDHPEKAAPPKERKEGEIW